MKNLTIRNPVGKNCPNNADDVATILALLRVRLREPWYSTNVAPVSLPAPGAANLHEALFTALTTFQSKAQAAGKPDGIVSPLGDTILFLGGLKSNGKQIIVDLDDQLLYAYEGASRVYKFDCTSGDDRHKTAERPTLFHIFRKEKIYRSKAYDAQMNYALFFSSDRKAIHQSNAVGMTSILKTWGLNYFGSHGCVRLSESDAAKLFAWAPSNTPVMIDLSREALG